MKKLNKLFKPGSTEQPRSDFNWPPTEEDLAPFGDDNTQTAHERLRAYFNWPADDDNAPAGVEPTPFTSEELRSTCDWPPVDEEEAASGIGAVQGASGEAEGSFSWPPPDEPVPATVVQETFEPWPAGAARQSDDSFSTPTPLPAAEYTAFGDAPMLNVEAAEAAGVEFEGEPGLDSISGGPWEVQIARLEALIERLTEKLEWRATGANQNEPRLKH